MPKAFDDCNKAGGKVRTVTKGATKGRLICIPKGKKTAKNHPVLGYKRTGAHTRSKRGG